MVLGTREKENEKKEATGPPGSHIWFSGYEHRLAQGSNGSTIGRLSAMGRGVGFWLDWNGKVETRV